MACSCHLEMRPVPVCRRGDVYSSAASPHHAYPTFRASSQSSLPPTPSVPSAAPWRSFPRCISIALLTTLLLLSLVPCGEGAKSAKSTRNLEINIKWLEQMGNKELYLSTIKKMAVALNKCGVDIHDISQMEKRTLTAPAAKCMDGSPAAYYLRKSEESKEWLIYLQGGSYCFSKESCNKRKITDPNLTSSTQWPDSMEGTGILSWDAEENPLFYKANIVYVRYCSGDAWTGNRKKARSYFRGSVIVEEVVKDLIGLRGGPRAGSKLYLAGSSAGGTGVLMNVDRVSELMTARVPGTRVLGIVDSGWFLDVKSHQKPKQPCKSPLDCRPSESVKKGYRLWHPQVPEACAAAYKSTPWNCFFGYKLYPYLKTPVFVIQYLYDRAQLYSLMQAHHLTEEQRLGGMRHISQQINSSLSQVTAAFAPSCFAHEILEHGYWHKITVGGVSLYDALKCWQTSQEATNRASPISLRETNSLISDFMRDDGGDRATEESSHTNRIRPRHHVDETAMSTRLNQLERKSAQSCTLKVQDTCLTHNCYNQCPPLRFPTGRVERSVDETLTNGRRPTSARVFEDPGMLR